MALCSEFVKKRKSYTDILMAYDHYKIQHNRFRATRSMKSKGNKMNTPPPNHRSTPKAQPDTPDDHVAVTLDLPLFRCECECVDGHR